MATKKKSSPQTGKKRKPATVNAQHSIRFTAPTIVNDPSIVAPEDEEDPEEVGEIEEDGETEALMSFEEEETEVAVKRPLTVKQRLRAKFAQRGIGGSETLKLRIDRMPTFGQDGLAGVKADKQFCGIVTCNDAYFDNDDYLVRIQQAYGAGDYWLQLRHKNTIVQQWVESVGGFAGPATIGENGQPSPTIIYNQPPHAPSTTPPVDPLQQLRGAFKIVSEFKDMLGINPTPASAPPQAAPVDPDTLLLQNLATNDKFMDKVSNGLMRKVLGDKAVDDDPTFGAVAMKMVETGQAEKAITAVGNFALRLADRIFNAWGLNNGSPQMGAQTVQDQTPANDGQNQNVPFSSVQSGSQVQRPAMPGANEGSADRPMDGAHTPPQFATSENPPTLMQVIPRLPISHAFQMVVQGQVGAEDITLAKLIDGCAREADPRGVLDWVYQFADTINEQLPDYSIDEYIEAFKSMTVDQTLAFIRAIPGASGVVELPHSRQWVEDLQKAASEDQTEESEEKE